MEFENEDLRAEELAAGVWALIARPTGTMFANCGLVDLGGTTLAWDSGMTLSGAASIREAAIALTGRPPDLLILSHPHPDHYAGAKALPESTYISSTASREFTAKAGPGRLAGGKQMRAAQLADLQTRLEAETDPAKRQELTTQIKGLERFLAGSAGPEDLRLPTLTVADSFTLHGTKRTAEFRVIGNGHSPSDGVLFLPAEKILFSGDVALPPGGNLFMVAFGDSYSWPGLLDRLEAFGAERLVPGHGGVTPVSEAVANTRAAIREMLEAVEAGFASGQGLEYAQTAPVGAHWAEPSWRMNLKGLLQQRLA